ncbi:MAG TPA: sarcosine oxidase subunit gamma family protein [Steroidobacteraceae bacterium]|nr:sarcosine oxidase subunit gamma family protein [Steroidobacteraceae bacterium]
MVDQAQRRVPSVPSVEWLTSLPPATRFAFHGGAAARAAAEPVWGVRFSEEACRANADATRATLWLGPDEYLLLEQGAGGPTATLFAALEAAMADVPHALVDVSHRQFAFELTGPHAATILSGACPLDLDLAQFPVGMCTRTVLAKADITLWRPRADAFHLEVWRSFAGYVTGVLTEIAAEFYPRG